MLNHGGMKTNDLAAVANSSSLCWSAKVCMHKRLVWLIPRRKIANLRPPSPPMFRVRVLPRFLVEYEATALRCQRTTGVASSETAGTTIIGRSARRGPGGAFSWARPVGDEGRESQPARRQVLENWRRTEAKKGNPNRVHRGCNDATYHRTNDGNL